MYICSSCCSIYWVKLNLCLHLGNFPRENIDFLADLDLRSSSKKINIPVDPLFYVVITFNWTYRFEVLV